MVQDMEELHTPMRSAQEFWAREGADEEKLFTPTIKDADPDDGPVPKDGCQITWLGWYWQVM